MPLNIQPSLRSKITAEVTFPPRLGRLQLVARAHTPAFENKVRSEHRGDIEMQTELLAKERFVSGSGLTRDVVLALVEVDDESQVPENGENGEIEFTPEMFAFLVRYARFEEFEYHISLALKDAKDARDRRKNG